LRDVESRHFAFTAPLGPIETGELKWYLESYWRWPVSVYKVRATEVEKALPNWGKDLFDEIRRSSTRVTDGVFGGWNADKSSERRFTIEVDRELMEGASTDDEKLADEASTLLLSLPWELLHDARTYLFEGPSGVCVRRRMPNREPLERPLSGASP